MMHLCANEISEFNESIPYSMRFPLARIEFAGPCVVVTRCRLPVRSREILSRAGEGIVAGVYTGQPTSFHSFSAEPFAVASGKTFEQAEARLRNMLSLTEFVESAKVAFEMRSLVREGD